MAIKGAAPIAGKYEKFDVFLLMVVKKC